MPPPMLLVHGEHLTGCTFRLRNSKALITKQSVSTNGRWAFLDISTASAAPGTFLIEARNADGVATSPYTLEKRRTASDQPRGFSSADVMYLIMTDRFADGDPSNDHQPGMPYALDVPNAWHGGDLRGIEQHLDYLAELGVTTIWITPVVQNREPESYHGYGATDLYKVDDHFGSLDDLRTLSNKLHERGMKLVLDIVPNHVGPAHPWVEDSPQPDWFHGTKANHSEAVGTFQTLLDPYAPWRDREKVLNGWFVNLLPDMNQENPAVSRYLIQNTLWWIEESGADGLRLDTFPYVGRTFWHDFHSQLRATYPKLTTVGEVFNGTFDMYPVLNSFFAGGAVRSGDQGSIDTGLDTPFDYPMYSAIRNTLLRGAPMSQIADILSQDGLYPHPERLVPLIGSHDTKRFLGEQGATEEKMKLAFAILLTMRGTPLIYSGDEIAMTGGDDPDNRRDFPGGFPHDGQKTENNAFDSSARTEPQRKMHDWVSLLTTLRKTSPELEAGGIQIEDVAADSISYVRGFDFDRGCSSGSQRVLVMVNKAEHPKTILLSTDKTALQNCTKADVLLGDKVSVELSSGKLQFLVQPESVVILRLK
ncbi:alpha-amylase family glycosyl hydrolase [Tunturibacter empetritectus]|uniref:Alpha-amylase family glycosyl hydrolase n=1 Tax=Tunturiibacter empetritectus TaxID=3069691 RepID=A0AAU7ZG96_9BACT